MRLLTGNGILTPIIAIAAFALGSHLGGFVLEWANASPEAVQKQPPLIGAWTAVAALIVFAFTAGRNRRRRVADPATGEVVESGSENAFLCLTPAAWAFLMLAFGVPFFWMYSKRTPPVGAMIQEGPGYEAFKTADSAINGASQGTAFGNTPEAIKLAQEFGTRLGEFRAAAIQGGRSTFSATRGQMVTYCLFAPPRCLFIVHVPELRNFADDAKEAISIGARETALSVTQKHAESLRTVAVGLRGALFYERMVSGKHGPGPDHQPIRLGEVRGHEETRAFLVSVFDATMREPKESAESSEALPQPTPAKPLVSAASKASPPAPQLVAKVEPPPAPPPAAMPATLPEVPGKSETESLRDWRDKDGRPLRARFARFLPGSSTDAEFIREDGKSFIIPVERFSTEDQAYLKYLSRPPERPNTKSAPASSFVEPAKDVLIDLPKMKGHNDGSQDTRQICEMLAKHMQWRGDVNTAAASVRSNESNEEYWQAVSKLAGDSGGQATKADTVDFDVIIREIKAGRPVVVAYAYNSRREDEWFDHADRVEDQPKTPPASTSQATRAKWQAVNTADAHSTCIIRGFNSARREIIAYVTCYGSASGDVRMSVDELIFSGFQMLTFANR